MLRLVYAVRPAKIDLDGQLPSPRQRQTQPVLARARCGHGASEGPVRVSTGQHLRSGEAVRESVSR
jgi:hypothetical protein